jgi:hypothetical protein
VEEVLIPLASFGMVVAIVGIVQAGRTVRYYLDWRMRMMDRQSGIRDRNVLQAVEELRAEIAGLRRHEAEAILSFDSTLQMMDARLKHLERRAVGETAQDRPLLAGSAAPGVVEAGRSTAIRE